MSLFISFEGIDGAGKSTHISFVTEALRARGLTVLNTREPGGTELGEQLRAILLREEMHPETEALLMFAGRREHIAQVIKPALARGDCVISDRFTDASYAYQGGGRGVPNRKLATLEEWTCEDLQPDLTFLFDVPLEVARGRLDATRTLDKFEQEKQDFFFGTRDAYLIRAGLFPDRIKIVDSSKTIDDIRIELTGILDVYLAAL